MEIILGRTMADKKDGNANEMDERADHDLSDVQSENNDTNILFGDGDVKSWRDRANHV